MKLIEINGKKHNIPQSWRDLTLKTFLEIRDLEERINEMSILNYNFEFVSLLTNIDIEDLKTLTPIKYGEIHNELLNITKQKIELLENPTIEINGDIYVMDLDTTKMSYGQFIDLSRFTKNVDTWEVAHKITASFLRKTTKRFFKRKINKYSYSELCDTSQVFFNKLPMDYIYTCVTFFFSFRTELDKSYEGLFPSANTNEIIDIDRKNEPKTLPEEYSERWSHYGILRELCNGDLTRLEEMSELNLITVLNDLSFKKETQDLERYYAKNKTY